MQIESINIDEFISSDSLTITREARNQTKTTNLLGDRVIDRGKLKYKISLKLNLLTNTEWSPLLAILELSSFNVTFYDAKNGTITREFSVDSIPSPKFIQVGNVTYYKNISLTLEEL